jgi:hypothetical protein
MPNRVIRESLLESDRWLELHDNTARVCYLATLLTADDVGNLEGTEPRLRRLWREYGADTSAKVTAILQLLTDADLVRVYQADGKRFLHVPRFRQFMRYVKRRVSGSPWDENEKIQHAEEYSQRERTVRELRKQRERASNAPLTRPEVKRSEENRSEVKRIETNHDIASLARQLGLKPGPKEELTDFQNRVLISFHESNRIESNLNQVTSHADAQLGSSETTNQDQRPDG